VLKCLWELENKFFKGMLGNVGRSNENCGRFRLAEKMCGVKRVTREDCCGTREDGREESYIQESYIQENYILEGELRWGFE